MTLAPQFCDKRPIGGTTTRYLAALLGWTIGGLAPPVATTVALVVWVSAACKGESDCSWGFELVLVIPVMLVCFFVTGPRMVGSLTARWVEPALRRPAARSTRLGAAIALVALYAAAGNGSRAFYAMLGVVATGVPAVVVWRTGARRAAVPPD